MFRTRSEGPAWAEQPQNPGGGAKVSKKEEDMRRLSLGPALILAELAGLVCGDDQKVEPVLSGGPALALILTNDENAVRGPRTSEEPENRVEDNESGLTPCGYGQRKEYPSESSARDEGCILRRDAVFRAGRPGVGRPATALQRPRSGLKANHGSPEGSFNESPLLHRWQRQSDLFDGVSYLEQPPGLGDEWLDPAFGLHGVCEDDCCT